MRLFSWIAAGALAAGMFAAPHAAAEVAPGDVSTRVDAVMPQVVAWRRDIHQHPELANHETRTSALVAAHLRRLGMSVRTGVAHTGVIGVLHGTGTGPGSDRVFALRAEMDALPVEEQTGLPFASHVRSTYNGQDTFVAHACGHDAHVAMLMGAATILAGMRDQFAGTIVFIFQPAEEGHPIGEQGGAEYMVEQGALDNPHPQAIFGVHTVPGIPGSIFYKPEGFMAASDQIEIALHGRQTHGAWPWKGIDIISLSAAIVQDMNVLAARTVDVTQTPTILTIASIQAGVRYNIIPGEAHLSGTLRTFDMAQRADIKSRITAHINQLAAMYGATAEVTYQEGALVTFNDPALSQWALPTLRAAAIDGAVNPAHPPAMVAEDFSYFQQEIPGLFVHIGASADGVDPETSAPNHSPLYDVNERVLPVGVRAHVLMALNFLESGGPPAH